MKTYVNIKTGNRFPEHGCAFTIDDTIKVKWVNGERIETHIVKHHIKPPYPECTQGWKKFNPKQWKIEEIPDFTGHKPIMLEDPSLAKEWIEYAKKWGVIVAQEFLECCDMAKPDWANSLLCF